MNRISLMEDKRMIFVIDVGNTNITCGIYREKELVTTFRLMTKTPRTSDEFGVVIRENRIAVGGNRKKQHASRTGIRHDCS